MRLIRFKPSFSLPSRQNAPMAMSGRPVVPPLSRSIKHFAGIRAAIGHFVDLVEKDEAASDLKPLAAILKQDPNPFRAAALVKVVARRFPFSAVDWYLRVRAGIEARFDRQKPKTTPDAIVGAIENASKFLTSDQPEKLTRPSVQSILDIAGFDLGFHQGFSAFTFFRFLKHASAEQRVAVLGIFQPWVEPLSIHYPPAASPIPVISGFPHSRIYPNSQTFLQNFYVLAKEKNDASAISIAQALKNHGDNPFKLKFLGIVAPSFNVVNFIKNFFYIHLKVKPRLAKRKLLPLTECFAGAFAKSYEWIKANGEGRKPGLDIWFRMASFDLGFNETMTAYAFIRYWASLTVEQRTVLYQQMDQYPTV